MSPQEQAQAWHDEQVEEDPQHEQFSSCWCCCTSCDPEWSPPGNPHWRAAVG